MMGRHSVLVAIIGLMFLLIVSCTTSPTPSPASSSTQTQSSSLASAQSPTSSPIKTSLQSGPSSLRSLPWSTLENASAATPVLPPTLPALSTTNNDPVVKSIVQVWGMGGDHSTGLVVGDGSQILTEWNFEDWNPTPYFNIAASGGGSYKAHIQAFDSRTAMTLLKADGMSLPTSTIIGPQNLSVGQAVIIREWDSQEDSSEVPMVINATASDSGMSFSIGYPAAAIQEKRFEDILPGAVVTDEQGSVLGVVGVFYNDTILAPHPHPTYLTPRVPPVASIRAIGNLLAANAPYQTWANLPLQAVISTKVISGIYTHFSENNVATSQALAELEAKLGNALPAGELKGYQRQGYPDYDGNIITVIYAFPVILRSLEGTQVAKARWVGIQWNRNNNAPNRLFFGNEASTVKGGFYLTGDVSALDQGVSALLPHQGPNGTVTITAPTPH